MGTAHRLLQQHVQAVVEEDVRHAMALHSLKATLGMQHLPGEAVVWVTGSKMYSGLLVRIATVSAARNLNKQNLKSLLILQDSSGGWDE